MGMKKYKVSDCYEYLFPHIPKNLTFEFKTTIKIQMQYLDYNGTPIMTEQTKEIEITPISHWEFIDFLGEHYDWNFLYNEKPESMYESIPTSALYILWRRFIAHNADNFTRALQDMAYEYNPIYNYDRNEIHYYNINETSDTTKEGGETHSISETGTITKTSSTATADSGTTYYGTPGTGTETSTNALDQSGGKSSVTWGSSGDFKTTNYINSYEDNTSSVPSSATNSTAQSGAVGTGTTGTASTSEHEDRNNLGHTDTLTFDSRKDSTDGSRTGQEGTKAVGNIGVTTSTAMVSESVLFRMKTNIATMILEKFAKENLFLGVFCDDD